MFLEQEISILEWLLKVLWHWRLEYDAENSALHHWNKLHFKVYSNWNQFFWILIIFHNITDLTICNQINAALVSIYIYAFSRRFYPKRLILRLHYFFYQYTYISIMHVCTCVCVCVCIYTEQNYKQHFSFCPHFSWTELKDLRLFYDETRCWGPLLCHSSTTITACCSIITQLRLKFCSDYFGSDYFGGVIGYVALLEIFLF